MLRGIAARKGIEPKRILSEKTNPMSSVGAMHCQQRRRRSIAHYPVSMYEESVNDIKEAWNDDTRQLTMIFEPSIQPTIPWTMPCDPNDWESEIHKYHNALENIASQQLTTEVEELGDIEYGYDAIIQVARTALRIEKAPPETGRSDTT